MCHTVTHDRADPPRCTRSAGATPRPPPPCPAPRSGSSSSPSGCRTVRRSAGPCRRRPRWTTRCSTTSERPSGPSTCSPTTRRGRSARVGSPPPTCCAPAPATSTTHPTPSSDPTGTTTWRPSSPGPWSTGWRSSPSVAAPRSPAAWPRAATGSRALVSLDLVRMKRLLAVDEVSMTATLEPGLRGPEAEALLAEHGLTLGHYPQSFQHASIGGFAATRSSGQSSAGYGRFDAMVVGLTAATPTGTLRPRLRAGQRRRPRPAPAAAGLGGRLRRHHLGHGARAARARRDVVRGLAVAVLRRRLRRDAHPGPGRADADRAAAVGRVRDGDQPRRPLVHRRRRGPRLPDGHRLRGHRRAGRDARRAAVTAVLDRSRRSAARRPSRGRSGRTGASTGPTSATRSSTTACSSRRSRPRPSGRTAAVVRRRQGRAHRVARRGIAGALPCLARLRDRLLALLHRRRRRATTRSPSGRRPRPRPATPSSRRARRSRTTTRSAPTTSRGSPRRSGRSGCGPPRGQGRARPDLGHPQPGVLIP